MIVLITLSTGLSRPKMKPIYGCCTPKHSQPNFSIKHAEDDVSCFNFLSRGSSTYPRRLFLTTITLLVLDHVSWQQPCRCSSCGYIYIYTYNLQAQLPSTPPPPPLDLRFRDRVL